MTQTHDADRSMKRSWEPQEILRSQNLARMFPCELLS
jgi:hypothetical protein